MRTRHSLAFGIFFLGLLLVTDASAVIGEVGPDFVRGRVFNTVDNVGIPGLSVHLIAPRIENAPVRITITTSDGTFEFKNLEKGQFLLLIYRGDVLLFRKEVDTNDPTNFTVALRPVG